MIGQETQTLTQLEFQGDDFDIAEQLAKRLGYTQTAYTSTSALWGLFCLRDRPGHRSGCVIKTKELGFLFVQDVEDLNLREQLHRWHKQQDPHCTCNDCMADLERERRA
jgi:hypothetical protein